jgi:hypothetical protein
MAKNEKLQKVEEKLAEIDSHIGLRRVVGDLFMIFDDPGHAVIQLDEIEKILLDEEIEDAEGFWNEIGRREISDISDIYELYSRLFPTVRDALELFNRHDKNEIKKNLFWDEESDLDDVILIPFSSEDGFFWFEGTFLYDAPEIRDEYAYREAQLKVLTLDGTVPPEEAEDYIKDSYFPEIEE